MSKPLISICIATYNRSKYLKECLESITRQFVSAGIQEKVDVIILDNQSEDDTEQMVGKYTTMFLNIRYIKDGEKRKIAQGIIKAASYADGEYIWIFSDDDLYLDGSLSNVIKSLELEKPDVVFCNMHGFVGANEVKYHNLLDVDKDLILSGRRQLFSFLDTKFFKTIDYYTTFCSNWILKKEMFDKNYNIFSKFNSALDLFPFPSVVFYTGIDCIAKVMAQPILLFRADNASWSLKNQIKQFFYHGKLWRYHYNNIVNLNRNFLPPFFAFKIFLKNQLRVKDFFVLLLVLFLKKFNLYDFVRKVYHHLKTIIKIIFRIT